MNAGIINNQPSKLPARKDCFSLTDALPPIPPANGPRLDLEVLKAINRQNSNALHGRLGQPLMSRHVNRKQSGWCTSLMSTKSCSAQLIAEAT
jgi:hypothetical protein